MKYLEYESIHLINVFFRAYTNSRSMIPYTWKGFQELHIFMFISSYMMWNKDVRADLCKKRFFSSTIHIFEKLLL